MSVRPAPLSRYPMVDTRDPEEAIALYARFTTPVHLDLPGRRRTPFSWTANCTTVAGITLSAHVLSCEVRTRTDAVGEVYSLSLPTGAARGEGWHGDESVQLLGSRRGIIISPGLAARGRLAGGYRGVQLNVRSAELRGAFATLTGADSSAPLTFRSDFESPKQGNAFTRHLGFLLAELDREDCALRAPLVSARHAEALLFRLLLDQPNSHSSLLHAPVRPADPAYVRRVAEYLDANLSNSIRMVELAMLTGLGLRALREGFQRHRGISPLTFLRERRLHRARELLLNGELTVTEVAFGCGFEHLGRFSHYYRARFGERPSQTRAKTRARPERP